MIILQTQDYHFLRKEQQREHHKQTKQTPKNLLGCVTTMITYVSSYALLRTVLYHKLYNLLVVFCLLNGNPLQR